jgi:hypothetical protein
LLEGIAQVGLGPQQEGAQQQQEEPMFGLEKVPYQPKGLKQMAVCNDVVAMALGNGHIIRLRVNAPDDLEGTQHPRLQRMHRMHRSSSSSSDECH